MERMSVIAASLLCLAVPPAAAQRSARTLFDQLSAVGVHVVGINASLDSMGVDSIPLRVALERQLERDGLEIRDRAALLARQETPRLVADVAGFRVDSAFFYTVTLELLEPVRLERSGLLAFAYPWSKQVVGLADAGAVRRAVAGAVEQLAGLFLEGRRRAMTVAVR